MVEVEDTTFTNPFLLSVTKCESSAFFCDPGGSLQLTVVFGFLRNCFNLRGQILISDLSVITGTWLFFPKRSEFGGDVTSGCRFLENKSAFPDLKVPIRRELSFIAAFKCFLFSHKRLS